MSDREALAPYRGKHVTITGVYYGMSRRFADGKQVEMAVIRCPELTHTGEPAGDHLNVQHASSFAATGVKSGERVQFKGVVYSYPKWHLDERGHSRRSNDWALTAPSDISLIDRLPEMSSSESGPEPLPEPLPPPPPPVADDRNALFADVGRLVERYGADRVSKAATAYATVPV